MRFREPLPSLRKHTTEHRHQKAEIWHQGFHVNSKPDPQQAKTMGALAARW
jgi:hypothetical protein